MFDRSVRNGGISTKLSFCGILACAIAFFAPGASAQTAYPTKPIRAVIPFAAAGNNDIVGRIVMEEMSKKLGQSIVVENRTGASGKVGTASVARAAPDGYTVLYTSMLQHVLNGLTDKELTYDSKSDFIPVAVTTVAQVLLIVSKKSGIRNMDDFVERARGPGLTCGSAGFMSSSHIWCSALMSAVGGKATHIPYQGAGPQVTAMLRGDIDFTFESYPTFASMIESQDAVPVGVLSDRRSDKVPTVPTMLDLGYPKFAEWRPYQILMVPKDTPEFIIKKLSEAAQATVADERVTQRIAEIGLQTVQNYSPDASQKLLLSDFQRWAPIVSQMAANPL